MPRLRERRVIVKRVSVAVAVMVVFPSPARVIHEQKNEARETYESSDPPSTAKDERVFFSQNSREKKHVSASSPRETAPEPKTPEIGFVEEEDEHIARSDAADVFCNDLSAQNSLFTVCTGFVSAFPAKYESDPSVKM